MDMGSGTSLSYHFMDSVICLTFTFFHIHFCFNIYIYTILYWCNLWSQKSYIFAWYTGTYWKKTTTITKKNQIFINHLSSGYEVIFQVVQLSPSSYIFPSVVRDGIKFALNVNLSSGTALISASNPASMLRQWVMIFQFLAGQVLRKFTSGIKIRACRVFLVS